MSSDVAISAVAASPPARSTGTATKATVPVLPDPVDSSPGSPNPTLHLDAALGLVVIEFLGKSGAVTSSIPTQQQLDAYKAGTEPLPGRTTHDTGKVAPRET